MNKYKKFISLLTLLVLFGIFSAVVAIAKEEPGVQSRGVVEESLSTCELAHQWVESHQGELPQNYEDFLKVPRAYRRTVFSALPSEIKSKIWIGHINWYLSNQKDLNDRQLVLLQEAIDFLKQPNLYAVPVDSLQNSEIEQSLLELEGEIRDAYGDKEAGLILEMGQFRDNSHQSEVESSSLLLQPECECSIYSDYCWLNGPQGSSCYDTACHDISWGCGTFGIYKCDGECLIF